MTPLLLTTGSNALHGGLDLVVDGEAVRVTDESTLRRMAEAWVAKYGEDWRFDVGNGSIPEGLAGLGLRGGCDHGVR